jgi:UDP-N-acetylglucosamine 2-epimerase (non-hydrolysing)
MLKILVVFGTRPEAIKLAPVILAARPDKNLELRVCVTAQHREMLDQVLSFFEIAPDYDLNIMRPNQELTELTANILLGIKDILQRERPDVIVVQGDTVSAFAAALSAFYARIPVVHVEAGLRTYDLAAPFPEEAMRQLISRVTLAHCAPTQQNRDSLVNEGVPPESVVVTGNTIVDALCWARTKLSHHPPANLAEQLGASAAVLNGENKIILVTGHRRESFGQGMQNICMAIRNLAKRHPDLQLIYPVHPNPNVTAPVAKILNGLPNVHLIDPLDYPSFLYLMDRCYLIISDSGGVQEEAPAFGKPVLVTREVTERQEGIAIGIAKLVGADQQLIEIETERLLSDGAYYASFVQKPNPYGDGRAAERILRLMKEKISPDLGGRRDAAVRS